MESASHSNLLWHYMGSFIFYTLLAIGVMYAAFVYLKKNPAQVNQLMNLGTLNIGGMRFGQSSLHSQQKRSTLAVETTLALEPRKTLYVVRAGSERFLIATSMEGTQFLAKLEENASLEEVVSPEAVTPETVTNPAAAHPGNQLQSLLQLFPKSAKGQ